MLAFKEIRMGVLYTQGKDIICLEIILQYLIGLSLQYRRKQFVSCFVTFRLSIGYKRQSKRCPFAIQKGTFYTSKDALLPCKRASFRMQYAVF